MHITGRVLIFLLSFCWVPLLFGTWAAADNDQDDVLVGRIAHVEGKLLRYVAEDKDWVATVQDAPFGLEDVLYAEDGAKAEFIMPNQTWIRIGGNTQMQMIALNPEATTVDVASGVARMYNKNRNSVIKATTPFGYVVAPEGAVFDLYVGDESMELIAVRGSVDFVHESTGNRYEVRERNASLIADSRDTARGNGTVDAAWDDWNGQRDSLWAKRLSSQGRAAEYLPEQIRDESYALEENGRWEQVYYEGNYRSMWRPTRIDSGWRPYTEGRWSVYYGDNCWIPSEPFGYVTHHYGSWVWVDSFQRWYWMPPARRVVAATPGLFISFGWYPGRVGWIHSGSTIGWIPLAPHEVYYGHYPWSRRVVVVNRGPVINININRFRYLDRAVIISSDHLYRGNRYTPYVKRLNRAAIINSYKPVPVINRSVVSNFDTDRRRFTFNDAKVDRRPHASVLNRIDNNRQFRQNAGTLDRAQIRQNLDQAPVAAVAAATTAIRSPQVSNKIVSAAQTNQPSENVSFPIRELKPKDRQRQIDAGAGQTINQRSRAESDQNQLTPGQKDDQRRMRSARDARDQVMQNITPTATAPAGMARSSGDPRPALQNRESGDQGLREPGNQASERRLRSPRETPSQEGGPPVPQRRQPRDPEASQQRQEVQQPPETQRRQNDQQQTQQETMRRQREAAQQQQQQEIQRRQNDQQQAQQETMRRQREAAQQQQQQEIQRRQNDQQQAQQETMRRQREAAQQQQQQEIQRRQAEQQQAQQETMRRQREAAQQQQQQEAKRRQAEQLQQQQQEIKRRQAEQQQGKNENNPQEDNQGQGSWRRR